MASVALAGSLAQRPGHGGHAWVFLNFLLGLRRLGHEVVFIDRHEGDDEGERWLREVLGPFGLDRDCILIDADPESRQKALGRLRRTHLLIDVNGYLGDEELLAAPETSAFLDIDPGIQQMWHALELASIFGRHDIYLTVGGNIGGEGCLAPECGVEWVPILPPVMLAEWQPVAGGSAFTSLATWRGPYGPIEFRGRTYGMRVHEFRRFVELPQKVDAELALALDIEAADERDIQALRGAGWDLRDPRQAAASPAAYKNFIASSLAELSIPKEIYVASRSGWFSDRSACYLAAGKPVLTIDTGFSSTLPSGEGLLLFEDVASAAAACEEVLSDAVRHRRAARELAAEYFDSDKVLGRVLNAAGI